MVEHGDAGGGDGSAGATQARGERIALVGGVLARCKDLGGGRVRIEFQDVNPPPCGVAYATITTEDLPGPFVKAELVVSLAPVPTGQGRASSSDRRRDHALEAAGWRIVRTAAEQAMRTLEVDPGDPGSVGDVVDAIESTFAAAASVPGAPPVPPATWTAAYLPPEGPVRTQGAENIPPDEPWLEAVTEADLRTRLVTLAGSRGGRIAVRGTDVAGAQLDLHARRRGDRIEVQGSDAMTGWQGSWTMSAAAPDAGVILRDLRTAIASRGHGGETVSLSIRLLQHDEAAGWGPDALGYLWLFATAAGIGVVALVSLVMLPSGAESVIDALRRGFGPDPDILSALPVVLVAFTALMPGMAAGEVVNAIAARRRLGYSTGAWLSSAAAALASAAYLVLVIAAGASWGIVVGAVWAIVIGRWAVNSLRRRRTG